MQNRFTVQFTARRLKEKFDKATKFEINLQEQQAMLHKGRTGGGGEGAVSGTVHEPKK